MYSSSVGKEIVLEILCFIKFVSSKLQRIKRKEHMASFIHLTPTKIMTHILRFNFEFEFSYVSCISLGRLVCLSSPHFLYCKIKV